MNGDLLYFVEWWHLKPMKMKINKNAIDIFDPKLAVDAAVDVAQRYRSMVNWCNYSIASIISLTSHEN